MSKHSAEAAIGSQAQRAIAIVGAGAAGLATAIFAAQGLRESSREVSIVLLEGAARIGAKILVAGGGRCNVTHDVVTPDDYHGSRNVVRNVLRAFDADADAAVRWFASRRTEGLHLVGEILDCDGRIGGFNFQWAWAGGYLTGAALARAAASGERAGSDA